MSRDWTEAVWQMDGLSPTERLLMLALARHADKDGVCWPSHSRIAALTGLTVRTIQRTLPALVERNHLDIDGRARNDGASTSNLYRLFVEDEEQLATL